MPKIPKICDICDKTPARYNKFFDKNLCEECKEDPEYKLIYKTTAKNKYFLNDKDIIQLECFEITGFNGYKHNCTMILVRELDVMNYFCNKHNINMNEIDETIEILQELKEKKSSKIKQTKKDKKKLRQKKLKKALNKMCVELRDDSKLCKGYIDGTIKDWDIEDIVKRMCEMKFLYEYANMKHYLLKAEKNQSKELEYGYIPDISVFDEAEMYALKKTNGYPKKWPWLVDNKKYIMNNKQ